MMKATRVLAEWDLSKKRWEVHIHAGSEVINRPIAGQTIESDDDSIRRVAVETARDEGYEVDPEIVEVLQVRS